VLLIDAVERDLLDADVFGEVLDVAMDRLLAEAPARDALIIEQQRLGKELANLAAAIAAGGDLQTLLSEIRARETRKADIERLLQRPVVDRKALRQAKVRTITRPLDSGTKAMLAQPWSA
jgi:hypothetical protein